METIAIILLLGAGQGVLLALVLLSIQRGNRFANRILASILIIFSISITLHTLSHLGNVEYIPHHAGIVGVLFFLVGPLFYVYVKILTDKTFSLKKTDIWHLAPFGIGILASLPFYLQISNPAVMHVAMEIFSILLVIQTLAYITIVIVILRRHSRMIRDTFSSLEKINLNWLRFLIIGYVLTWIIALILEGVRNGQQSWDFGWLFVSGFMYAIGYRGLKQPEIFSGDFEARPSAVSQQASKYEKSTLTAEQAEIYFQKLKQVMATEKPFLQNNITMPGLAKSMAISPHHLSRVINEKFQQNFFEFINQHRVMEAKKMLRDSQFQHLNISAIGLEAGFNSISAFNAAFKKHTGITPSAFRSAG